MINKAPLEEKLDSFMTARVFNIVAAWITGLILAVYAINTRDIDGIIGVYADSLMQQIEISKDNPFIHLAALSIIIALLSGRAIKYTLIIWDGFSFSFNSALMSILVVAAYLFFKVERLDSIEELINVVYGVLAFSFLIFGLACNFALHSAMSSPEGKYRFILAFLVVLIYPLTWVVDKIN